MINVEKVTKYFDDFCALDEFSLKVESGSAYGLLGSNGAGKIHTAAYPCRNIQAGQRRCDC